MITYYIRLELNEEQAKALSDYLHKYYDNHKWLIKEVENDSHRHIYGSSTIRLVAESWVAGWKAGYQYLYDMEY